MIWRHINNIVFNEEVLDIEKVIDKIIHDVFRSQGAEFIYFIFCRFWGMWRKSREVVLRSGYVLAQWGCIVNVL